MNIWEIVKELMSVGDFLQYMWWGITLMKKFGQQKEPPSSDSQSAPTDERD